MIQMPYEQIIQKIIENSSSTKEDIETKIKAKTDQLAGLISKEGAAHIVANELGVKLFDAAGLIKINKIYPGMRNIETAGKIVRIFPINTFKSGEREGKVGSLVLGDETGTIRLVFWNNKTEELEKLKEEDVLHISNSYLKENQGRLELHINDSATIKVNPEDIKIDSVTTTPQAMESQRRKISELKEGESSELLGTIVQVYEPRFFEVCPECGKRVRLREDKYPCDEHGNVTPAYSYVLSLFLDDGSGSIRLVLWQQQTNELLKTNNEDFAKYRENMEAFDPIKTDLLGGIIKVGGRAVKNTMFDRMEFLINTLDTNPDPDKEIEKLDKEIEVAQKEK